jgi:hypothetical protein
MGAPVLFVAAHDLRNAESLALGYFQQLVGTAKGQGQHRGVWCNDFLAAAIGGHFVADDKAAAHRVVGAVTKL